MRQIEVSGKIYEITEDMILRFVSKIKQVESGCWNWLGGKDKNGYGYFSVGSKTIKAHRFSYTLYNGPIPPSLSVLHRCDNPSCVNPFHLWIGTPADNAKDRDKKKRGKFPFQKGENHLFVRKPELGNRKRWKKHPPETVARGEGANNKITTKDVVNIRKLRNQGRLKLREIADMYNISEAQVSRLARGKSWKHLEIREVLK